MKLKMFIAEQLIGSVEINAFELNSPGYIDSLRIQLQEDSEEILQPGEEKPQFFIEHIPSRMNGRLPSFKN